MHPTYELNFHCRTCVTICLFVRLFVCSSPVLRTGTTRVHSPVTVRPFAEWIFGWLDDVFSKPCASTSAYPEGQKNTCTSNVPTGALCSDEPIVDGGYKLVTRQLQFSWGLRLPTGWSVTTNETTNRLWQLRYGYHGRENGKGCDEQQEISQSTVYERSEKSRT